MSSRGYVVVGAGFILTFIGVTVFALDASTTSDDEYVQNEKDNLSLNLTQKTDELKSWQQQLKDQKRCAGTADTTVLDGHLSSWGIKLGEGTALAGQVSIGDPSPIQPAWDKIKEIDDLRYDVQDEINKLNTACDTQNKKNTCEERQKDYDRHMGGQLKDIKRRQGSKSVDLTPLDNYMVQFKSCVDTVCVDAGIAKDTFWDDQRACEDIRTEFYDTINGLNQTINNEECKTNAQSWMKDTERDINSNIKREYERLTKQAEGDVSELKNLYDAMQAQYKKMQDLLAVGFQDCNEFWDMQRDFDDTRKDYWDRNNDLNQVVNMKQQARDIARNVKDQRRSQKDMERELKNVTRRLGEEPAALRGYMDCLTKNIDAAEAVAETDTQAAWDSMSEAGQCSNDFWNEIRDYQDRANIAEQCDQNWKRELSDWQREIKRISRESIREGGNKADIEKLQSYVTNFEELKNKACGGEGNSDDIRDIETDIQDLRQEWWDAMQAFNENREFKFFGERVSEMARDMERAIKKLAEVRDSGQYSEAKITLCTRIVGKAKTLVERMREGYEAKDRGVVQDAMEEIEFLKGQGGQQCGFLFGGGGGPDIRQFVQVNLEGISGDAMESLIDKISNDVVNKVMGNILALQESLVQQMMERVAVLQEKAEKHMATLLESVTALSNDQQNVILSAKNETLSAAEQLKAVADRLQSGKLNAVLSRVEEAVVIGDSAQALKSTVENFVSSAGSLSGSALDQEISDLDEAVSTITGGAQEQLYVEKVVPYRDIPLGQWFARHVFDLTNEGIVSGKRDANGQSMGVFDPGQRVKVSEMLRMIFEANGVGEQDGDPALAQARGHWARGYVRSAEEEGISLVLKRVDINREATRAEVCRMILESQGEAPAPVSEIDFPDVSSSHPDAPYIQVCKDVGLFEGDGKGNFRPDDGINRAEAAKVIRAAMILQVNDDDADASSLEDFESFGFESETQTTTTTPTSTASGSGSGAKSRCWWDNQCTELMSALLITKDECITAGGQGWGPDNNNCEAL